MQRQNAAGGHLHGKPVECRQPVRDSFCDDAWIESCLNLEIKTNYCGGESRTQSRDLRVKLDSDFVSFVQQALLNRICSLHKRC